MVSYCLLGVLWRVLNARAEDPFRNLPSVETERLLLRKVRLDDAQDMFEYGAIRR